MRDKRYFAPNLFSRIDARCMDTVSYTHLDVYKRQGLLRMVGNHPESAKAEGGLTATPTGGAGTKVGLSDPVA